MKMILPSLLAGLVLTGCAATTPKFSYKQPPLHVVEELDDSWVVQAPLRDVRTYLKDNLNIVEGEAQVRTASNYIEVVMGHKSNVVPSIVHLELSKKDKNLTLIKYSDVTEYSRSFAGVMAIATIYLTGPYYAIAIPTAKRDTKVIIKKSMHIALTQSQNE